jgi:hypothetical protein
LSAPSITFKGSKSKGPSSTTSRGVPEARHAPRPTKGKAAEKAVRDLFGSTNEYLAEAERTRNERFKIQEEEQKARREQRERQLALDEEKHRMTREENALMRAQAILSDPNVAPEMKNEVSLLLMDHLRRSLS